MTVRWDPGSSPFGLYPKNSLEEKKEALGLWRGGAAGGEVELETRAEWGARAGGAGRGSPHSRRAGPAPGPASLEEARGHLASSDARVAESVSFAVPTERDKNLAGVGAKSGPSAEAFPQRSLVTAFSQFGLLYSVGVFPNAAVARPGFCAIIKFYSARDAHRAQRACHEKHLFQNSPLKVHLGTKHKAVQHQALALNSSQCQELANYYFGFNGWSKRIIKLQDLSDLEERENEDTTEPLQKQSLQFFCALEVVLPSYECKSLGVGMVQEPLDKLQEGPLSFLMKRKTTQKLPIKKAMSDAFQKLLVAVLESGKIAVEYRQCEEITDARTQEELHDLIQHLPWVWGLIPGS
uniref:DM1 domain-containing protein n=1 Tax=Canis lupus familiaris TaxID=9615 RepID=A0A8I3PIE4_CANLF